jgi:hypothetical protein
VNSKDVEFSMNRNQISLIVPGMLESAKNLIVFGSTQWESNDLAASVPGIIFSVCMISGHCTEIILKYKLHKKNKEFDKTHDLHSLYNLLDCKSKKQIDEEFKTLKSNSDVALLNGWNSVNEILNKSQNFSMNIRYDAFELYDGKSRGFSYDHKALYLAAVSIFLTTDISKLSHKKVKVSKTDLDKIP